MTVRIISVRAKAEEGAGRGTKGIVVFSALGWKRE